MFAFFPPAARARRAIRFPRLFPPSRSLILPAVYALALAPQALHLYPIPDVLVLADKFDAYNLTYDGCLAFNPGSFHSTDFAFMVYSPSKVHIDPTESEQHRAAFNSRIEFSQIE